MLVHPGGPFWRNTDDGAWTIPKGELLDDESPLACAIREFHEELGANPTGSFIPLRSVRQKGGKLVHAWAFEGDFDVSTFRSNTFTIEWPPRSGKQAEFPEIDRAEFFELDEAGQKINPAQIAFLDELKSRLG